MNKKDKLAFRTSGGLCPSAHFAPSGKLSVNKILIN